MRPRKVILGAWPMRSTLPLFSPGVDRFLEDFPIVADRVFYPEGGPRDTLKLTAKTWLKNERSEDV